MPESTRHEHAKMCHSVLVYSAGWVNAEVDEFATRFSGSKWNSASVEPRADCSGAVGRRREGESAHRGSLGIHLDWVVRISRLRRTFAFIWRHCLKIELDRLFYVRESFFESAVSGSRVTLAQLGSYCPGSVNPSRPGVRNASKAGWPTNLNKSHPRRRQQLDRCTEPSV